MKVLTVCNYITNKGHIQTKKNNTGYGHMVNDIVFGLSPFVDIDVFTFSGSYTSFNIHGVCFRSNFYLKRLAKVKVKYSYQAFIYALKGLYSKENFRTALSIASSEYYKTLVKDYDIVHVHGCTPNLMVIVELCLSMNKKVVVTLHGLNSVSNENQASFEVKNAEKRLFSLNETNLFFSVLTPAAKSYLTNSGVAREKIKTIPNFIKLNNSQIIDRSNIEKVVLYIGNISVQKNQKALLDTIEKHYDNLERNFKFIFVGNIPDNFDTNKYKAYRNIEFLGQVDRSEVNRLYRTADATILLSHVEGFGLSIIEGFSYGLPTIVNQNIEICSLLEDKTYIFKISDVSDCDEILKGIKNAVSWSGDKKEVIKYANEFCESEIIRKYIDLYNDVF